MNELFPSNEYKNIGEKVDYVGYNQYINNFFYKIYNDSIKNQYDAEMIKSYFNLNVSNIADLDLRMDSFGDNEDYSLHENGVNISNGLNNLDNIFST